jgi:hypothetical protein
MIYFLMNLKSIAAITSIIVITIILTITTGSGTINLIQIQNASAQNQSSSNSSSQIANMISMDDAIPSLTPSSNFTGSVPIFQTITNALKSLIHEITSPSTFSNFTGSVPIFQTITNALKSNIHISLNDAVTTAEMSVGNNSTALASFIHPENGFIVYNVFAIDSNNNIHRVIIDPGDGKVLSSEQLTFIEMMKLLHGGGGFGSMMKMDHGMGMDHGVDMKMSQ